MKKILLHSILLLSILNCNAQSYFLGKEISGTYQNIEVDKFGNFYLVAENSIKKYSEQGEFLNNYNDLENGIICNLDVSNPLKPIVFYQDFSVLVVLDQKLNPINTIHLNESNLGFLETIICANSNNYWVFDNQTNTLKKLDKSFQNIYESENFLNIFSESQTINKIVEHEQYIYVQSKEGIHLFDNFANYKQTIPLKGLKDFQVIDKKIIYWKQGLMAYNLRTLVTEKLRIPEMNSLITIKIFKGGLLKLTADKVELYVLK